MATFDFTSPEGKSYSVEGPDGATPEQAFQILQQHLGNSAPGPSVGEDVLGVAKTAPQRIAAGLAGIPADLAHLYAPNQNDPNPLGTEALNQKFGVAQPQTAAGRVLGNAIDFAPALIGGPESLGAKIATRAVVPAISEEVGNQIGGPIGGFAGALAGAGGAGALARGVQGMTAAKSAAKALPTGEDLLQAGRNQFNTAKQMDVAVKPEFAKDTAAQMRDAISDYDPDAIKPVHNAINRLDDLYKPNEPNPYNTLIPAKPAAPVEMNDVENIRKQLSSLRISPDPSIRTAAKTAQEVLTKNQMGLTAADAISGDIPAYAQTMKEAVGNYAAGKRSNIIQGKVDLADLNAATAGSGANIDNNTRQAFKQLVRPMNNTNVPVAKKLGFNDAEIGAIRQAATGTTLGNTARLLGKGAPTGIVSAVGGAGLGHMAGGPVGAIALPAASYIAKKIGDLSTKRAVQALDSLVRSRSPLASEVAARLPPAIVQQISPQARFMLTSALSTPALVHGLSQQVPQPANYQR